MSCWFLEYYCGLDQQLPAITFTKQIDYKIKEISNLVFQPEFCQPFNCFLYEFYPEVEVCDGQNFMTAVFDYHAISLFRRNYNHFIFTSMRDRMIQVTKYNLFIDTSDSTKVFNSYLNLTLKLQILEFKPVKDHVIPKKIIDQAESLFQEQRIKERIANFRHWFYRSLLRNGASSIQVVAEHQQYKKNDDLEIIDEGVQKFNQLSFPTLSQVFDESVNDIKQNKLGEKNNQESNLNFGAIIQKTQVFRLKPEDFLKKEYKAVKTQTKQSRLTNKDQNIFQVVNQPQKQCGLSLNTEEQLFSIFGVLPEFRDICPFSEISEFDEQISKRREILVPKASIFEINRLIIQEKGETFFLEKKAAKIKKFGDLVEETKRRQQLALKCQHYQLYQNANNQLNINQNKEDQGLKQTVQPTRKIIGYEFQLSRSNLKEKILKILNTDDNEKIDVSSYLKKAEAKRSQSAQIQKSTMNIRPRANSQENILQLRDVEENHDDRSLNHTITEDGKSQKSQKRVLRREFKKEALSQINPQPNLINDETQSEEDSLDQQINNNIDTPSLLIDRPIEDIILMPSEKNQHHSFSCMNQQLFQSYMEWLTGDSITSFNLNQNNQDYPSEQEKIEQILDRRFFVAKKQWFDNYQEEKSRQQIKNEQEFSLNDKKDGDDDVEMKEEEKVVERKVANHKYTTRSKQDLPNQDWKSTMNNSLKAQDTQSNIEDDYAEKQDSLVKNRRGKKPKQIEMKQIHPEKLQQKKEEIVKQDLKDEQNDEFAVFSKMDDESHPLMQSQINITSSIKVTPTFTKSKDVFESPKKEQINQNQEDQQMKEYPKANSIEKQTKREIKIIYRPPFEEKQLMMEPFQFTEPKPIKEKDKSEMTDSEIAIYKQDCKIYNLKFQMAQTAYLSKKKQLLLLKKQYAQTQQTELALMAEAEKETKEYLQSEVQDEDADWAEVMPEEKPIEDEESRYQKQKEARKFRQRIVRKMLDKSDLIDQHLTGLHAKKQSILTVEQEYQENKQKIIQQNKKVVGSFGVQLSESTPISNTDSIMGSIHSNYINSKSVKQMSVDQSPRFKAPIEESEEEQFQEEILQSEEELIAEQPEEEMEVQEQPYGDEIDLTYQSSIDENIHQNQEYDQEEEDDDQQDNYYQMQKHRGRSNDFVNIKHQLKNREEIERQKNIGNFRQSRDRREHEIYNSKLERSSKVYPIKEERFERRKEYIQQKSDIILSPKHKKKIQSPKSPKVDVKAGLPILPIGQVALPNPEMLKKIKNDPDTMMNMMLQMYQAVQQLTSGQKQAAVPPRNRHRNGQSRRRHYRDEYDEDQSCSEFIVSDDPDAEQYQQNVTNDSFDEESGFPPDQEDSVEDIGEDDEIDDKDYLLPTFSQGEASQMNHEEDFDDVQDIRYTSSEKKRNRQIRSKSPENVPSYKVRLNEPIVAPFSDNELGSFGTESQVNEEECEEDYPHQNRHKAYYHRNRVPGMYDQQRYHQEKYMSHTGLKRSSSSYHEPWRHQKGYYDEKRYHREEDEDYGQHLDLDEMRNHHKSRKYYQQNQKAYSIHKEEEPIRKRRRTEIEEEQKFQSENDLTNLKYKNLKEFAQQAVLETTFKAVTSMVSEKHRDRQKQMKEQSRKSRMYTEEHSLSEGGNMRRYYDENKRVDKSQRKHEEQILRYQSAKPINGNKRIEHTRRS